MFSLICCFPSFEYVASAAFCTIYDTPLNFVQVLRCHNLFKLTCSPFFVYPFNSFGTMTYAHLNPVNPAVFEKLLNSIATSFAPSISYILCGTSSLLINASNDASYKIIDLFSLE